jgi:hypothetical protein
MALRLQWDQAMRQSFKQQAVGNATDSHGQQLAEFIGALFVHTDVS